MYTVNDKNDRIVRGELELPSEARERERVDLSLLQEIASPWREKQQRGAAECVFPAKHECCFDSELMLDTRDTTRVTKMLHFSRLQQYEWQRQLKLYQERTFPPKQKNFNVKFAFKK